MPSLPQAMSEVREKEQGRGGGRWLDSSEDRPDRKKGAKAGRERPKDNEKKRERQNKVKRKRQIHYRMKSITGVRGCPLSHNAHTAYTFDHQ